MNIVLVSISEVIITTTPPFTTTPTPKPTYAPLDLVSTDASHNSVSLAWSSISLPNSLGVIYVVEYRKKDSNEQWMVAVDSLKDNSYVVRNLDPDTMYVFNVRAVMDDGSFLTQGLKKVLRRTEKQPLTPKSKRLILVVKPLLFIMFVR